MKELSIETRDKFDRVLSGVIEPQSELSIGELGLVKKFSYHENEKTIVVNLDVKKQDYQCPACFAVDQFVIDRLERDIRASLEKEFPNWTITFA
jgi:metal-sulfur cluster biosynthetic enzyme